MYRQIPIGWKTYNEMNAWEQMEFRNFGKYCWQRRRKGKEWEYLITKEEKYEE